MRSKRVDQPKMDLRLSQLERTNKRTKSPSKGYLNASGMDDGIQADGAISKNNQHETDSKQPPPKCPTKKMLTGQREIAP